VVVVGGVDAGFVAGAVGADAHGARAAAEPFNDLDRPDGFAAGAVVGGDELLGAAGRGGQRREQGGRASEAIWGCDLFHWDFLAKILPWVCRRRRPSRSPARSVRWRRRRTSAAGWPKRPDRPRRACCRRPRRLRCTSSRL